MSESSHPIQIRGASMGCCSAGVDIYTHWNSRIFTHIYSSFRLWYNFHRLLFDDEKEEKLYQRKKNISSNTHGRWRRAALASVNFDVVTRTTSVRGTERSTKKTWNSFSRSDSSEFFRSVSVFLLDEANFSVVTLFNHPHPSGLSFVCSWFCLRECFLRRR